MVIEDGDIQQIRTRFEKLAWALDERMRRLFAAAEAAVLGGNNEHRFNYFAIAVRIDYA